MKGVHHECNRFDMSAIDLTEKNLLWRFYCKNYTLQDQEILPPRNLCRFWWIAVFGFNSWVIKEAKIRYLWIVTILTTMITFALVRLFPEGGNIFREILITSIVIIWGLFCLLSLIIPSIRTFHIIEKKAPRVVSTAVGGVMLALLVWAFTDAEMRGEILMALGIVFGVMVSIMAFCFALILILPYLAERVPDRFLDGTVGTFLTSVAYFKAKKRKVCPLVNPPEDFEE